LFGVVLALGSTASAMQDPAPRRPSPERPSPERPRPERPAPPAASPAAEDLVLPEFESDKPRFRKLIYGIQDEKPAVWLVVDGTDVLCDINRDGDLTDPDERQSYDGREAHFIAEDIEVWYHKNLVKSKYQGLVQGRLFPPSASSAAEAPVFHIAGPLAVLKQEYRNRLDTERKDFLIYVNIGTEYPGVQRTEVRYECMKRTVKPLMRIRYEDGASAEFELGHRC